MQRRLDTDGNFLATLLDLHEFSVYCVKTSEGDTEAWHPELRMFNLAYFVQWFSPDPHDSRGKEKI